MTEQEALDCHAEAQELQFRRRHAEALRKLERAASYFTGVEGSRSPDLANIFADWSESLLAVCRFDEAEERARQGKAIVETVRDLLDSDTRGILVTRVYAVWGRSLREMGRYEDASLALTEAIREGERCFGGEHSNVAWLLNEYGILCKYWGRFDESERHYLRALRILAREFGEESAETATIYHNLGGLEHARGDYVKGEPLGRRAYEIRLRVLGEDDPDTVADSVAWAGLLDGLQRWGESVPIYRRALAYFEERLGPEHFEVAATLNNLGMARVAQGEISEARKLLARSLAIKQRLFKKSHPEIRLTRSNLRATKNG